MAALQNLSCLLEHAAQDSYNHSITIYGDVDTSSESSIVVSEHRISYTFGPNFFLAILVQKLESFTAATISPTTKFFIINDVAKLDLSCLRYLISGGESNVVATCALLTT